MLGKNNRLEVGDLFTLRNWTPLGNGWKQPVWKVIDIKRDVIYYVDITFDKNSRLLLHEKRRALEPLVERVQSPARRILDIIKDFCISHGKFT